MKLTSLEDYQRGFNDASNCLMLLDLENKLEVNTDYDNGFCLPLVEFNIKGSSLD